ncbi:MAG TPA: nuclear transport factor 2 family protein [Acidimicrobiales bacterium]
MTWSDQIADRLTLREVSDRYARAVDRRDADAIADIFTEDAELSIHEPAEAEPPSRVLRGRSEISGIPRLIARYPKTFHFMGNALYEIDDDSATGEVYCVAHHLTHDPAGATDYVMLIRYLDAYQRCDDGRWRISSRRLLVDWTEDRATG